MKRHLSDPAQKAPVLGYARVSSVGQATVGVSLEAQETRLREAGAVQVFVDAGRSGRKMKNRPELEAALRAVEAAPGSTLVVYSLSRLARSTRDALDISRRIDKAGARLVSVTESIDTKSAMGRCFFAVAAAFAQLESDQASERTIEGLSVLKAKRMKLGGARPYGYDVVDGRLVPNAGEQKAIKLMRRLKAAGRSLTEIGDELRARGIRSRSKSGLWQKTTVFDILARDGRSNG
jgi:DNA invertase Pin-like site-specific DNA recombinase